MCGRYTLDFETSIYLRYGIKNHIDFAPRYNIAPSQSLPVITEEKPAEFTLMRWGLVPFWEEKKEKPRGLINIRDDSVLGKPWGKRYLQSQRCLVPATGFFEWKRGNGGKTPYYFHLKNEEYFSFAGLYSTYKEPLTGQTIAAYSIITTSPNAVMKSIHHRMPVILEKKDEESWLNPDTTEPEKLKEYLHPYHGKPMEAYEVATYVNSPRNDDKSVLERVGAN